MHPPLIVQETDTKWNILKEVLKIFDSRRARQELAKSGIRVQKGVEVLKIVLTAMFFSLQISYVVSELNAREELRRFLNIEEVLDFGYISSFLSRFTPESFIAFVSRLLNLQCGK